MAHFQMKKYDHAAARLRKAIELDPKPRKAHDFLRIIYAESSATIPKIWRSD